MAGPRLPGAGFFDIDGVATPHSTGVQPWRTVSMVKTWEGNLSDPFGSFRILLILRNIYLFFTYTYNIYIYMYIYI